MPRKIYLIGSLRDPDVKLAALAIKAKGHEVFAGWHGCGPDADVWQRHEQFMGRSYADALFAPLAQHALDFDTTWLDWCDTGVLAGRSGTSAHIEACYLSLLQMKPVYWLMTQEPAKWDPTPRLWLVERGDIVHTLDDLLGALG